MRVATTALFTALVMAIPTHAAAAPPDREGDIREERAQQTTLTAGTHNVFRGKAKFTEFASVIGWQEVENPADRVKMRESLPKYRHYVPTTKGKPARVGSRAIPISWRADRFALLNKGTFRTHEGEKKVTPARHVNWVALQDRKTKQRFAFVNTHFISGAWSGHPERRERWNTHRKKLKKLAERFARNGHPVFVVGDFNRHARVGMHGLKAIPTKSGRIPLDHIYAGNAKPKPGTAQRLAKHGSDHHAWRAKVTF